MKCKMLKAIFVGLVLNFSGLASAALIIDAAPDGEPLEHFGAGIYSTGSEFTLSTGLFVDGLAFVDIGSDGLSEDHMVGLWSAAGELLAQANVTNDSTIFASQSSFGQWFVAQIDELFLEAGTYRVVGFVGNEPTPLTNGVAAPGVSLLRNGHVRNHINGGLTFPDLTFQGEHVWASLTSGAFPDSDPVDVPEPSKLGFLALGLIGLGARRFKK